MIAGPVAHSAVPPPLLVWGQVPWPGPVHRGPSLGTLATPAEQTLLLEVRRALRALLSGRSWSWNSHLEAGVPANCETHGHISLTFLLLLLGKCLIPALGPQISSIIKASYCLD